MPLVETEYTAAQTYDDYTVQDKLSVFGGEIDLWGATVTPETLKAPEFEVIFDADVGAGTLRVDQIYIEVFFTVPMGQYDPDGLPPFAESVILAGCVGRSAEGRSQFVVVGSQGLIRTSYDGLTWLERESGVAETLRSVSWGPVEGFVATGDGGVVVTSPDGVTWTRNLSGTDKALVSVTYDAKTGEYTAVGADGVIRRVGVDGYEIIRL